MYRIFDITRNYNKITVPCDINYKIALNASLVKGSVFTKGRITHVTYKDVEDNLVLDVQIVYETTTDPLFPLKRTTTRCWYNSVGVCNNIIDFDKTVKEKFYDPRQTIDEGIVRRGNIIDHLFSTAAIMGYLTEASGYIKDKANEIFSYRLINDQTIITTVTNDTSTWLNDFVPDTNDTITMRELIIDALTIN